MAQETFVDPQAVTAMANGFGDAATTLNAIAKALEVAIAALHAAAFFSLGGTEMMAQYLSNIKPHVENLAKLSDEAKAGIIGARNFLENGDSTGSKMFIG